MKLLVTLAAAALVAGPAAAQVEARATTPPRTPGEPRISQLIVYGSDPCPQSSEDEIVVCARKPEGDRYRIPENLRSDPNDPANQSWTNKAIELSYAGRTGTGSCSPVGPGGFTGCFEQMVREARAERATRDSVNWNRLIEEARQERLDRIDAEAEAVEQEAREKERP